MLALAKQAIRRIDMNAEAGALEVAINDLDQLRQNGPQSLRGRR